MKSQQDVISLIICTRNREKALFRCLDAIRSMVVPGPWELIVVDNGSQDSTRQIVEHFAADVEFPVLYIYERLPGSSRAKNRGIEAASGSVIVFTDDDCYPQPDFLDQARSVLSDPGIHFFGGRVLLYDAQDYPITIKTSTIREVLPSRSYVEAGFIHGANMGFRREAIDAVGGFDETFGAGTPFSGEDAELISRVSARGFTGVYDPRPVVFHHHRRRSKEEISSLKRYYAFGAGAYLLKCILDPDRRRPAAMNWYRSTRSDVRRSLRQPRALLHTLYRMEGALWYLFSRRAS